MNVFQTSLLSEAAYMNMKNLRIVRSFKGSSGETVFEFEDPSALGEELRIEYINSDFAKFDDSIRKMRSLIKSNR